MNTNKMRHALLLASFGLLPSVAFAHPGHETAGMLSGMLHPLLGWDHLLAMVAVGMLLLKHAPQPVGDQAGAVACAGSADRIDVWAASKTSTHSR